ncbi:hypothetical protein TTRE_0000709601 [Trichuris trichiura]|uniref:Uncharacterized protein n=1 Tax=Trichuris trichiura TaxID=36087 RepID=A0A077ZEK2_TRITR|nr:hypothetical protein TTRE_0000709601 [Trichuris trichiura]
MGEEISARHLGWSANRLRIIGIFQPTWCSLASDGGGCALAGNDGSALIVQCPAGDVRVRANRLHPASAPPLLGGSA